MFDQNLLPENTLALARKRKFRTTTLIQGEGEGLNTTTQRGFGIEFAEYRAYEPGDNPKHIDWNHFAKTDKLYIKLFSEEKALSVLILVDSSASMNNPASKDKWRYVKNLTLMLAAIGLTSGERITVAFLEGLPLVNLSRISDLKLIADAFDTISTTGNHDFTNPMLLAQKKTRSPSQAIIISDFMHELDPIKPALDSLAKSNVAVTGIQTLAPSDFNPLGNQTSAEVTDSESGVKLVLSLNSRQKSQLLELINEHSTEVKKVFYKRRAKFFSINTESSLVKILNEDFRAGGLLA